MVTIQEPVAVGDVRLSKDGPVQIEAHKPGHDVFFTVVLVDGMRCTCTRRDIETWPLLCPAEVRRGDVFKHPTAGQFICGEPGRQQGAWLGHHDGSDSSGMFPAVACLEGGWRIASRGPMPAQAQGEEAVEVGQVRAWSHSDVRFLVNKHFADSTAECVNAGDTWQRLDQSAIQRGSRVICPAPDKLRAGDRFVDVETGDIVLTDNGYGGYNVNLSMDRKQVRDLCLSDGYRLASRGPATQAVHVEAHGGTLQAGIEAGRSYATIEDLKHQYLAAGIISRAEAGALDRALEKTRGRVATWGTPCLMPRYESAPRLGTALPAGVEPSSQVARWLSDGTLSSEEAEKFAAVGRRAPHSAIDDHFTHRAHVCSLKTDAARVRRTPWYRSPAGIRSANVSAANEAQRLPHPLVLLFGERRGEAWDRYLRELSATVEWANARPEPIRLEAHHVLACVTGAVR